MISWLQARFLLSSPLILGSLFCIFMLLFSTHTYAANSHKAGKKAPKATYSVTKGKSRNKRNTIKSNAHQLALNHRSNKSSHRTQSHKASVKHNPFQQNDLSEFKITSGMHPKITLIQKNKLKKAKTKIVSNLMKQLGKPYRYGGMSPNTGFDCSGLVNYAYREQLKSTLPRTADSMFHMSEAQAREIEKEELHEGDLVFFSTHRRKSGHADHVGVYLGSGQFIQAPRSGKDIQISRLDDDYWQEHYIGARRVLLPQAVR